jgi:hypothetical protein
LPAFASTVAVGSVSRGNRNSIFLFTTVGLLQLGCFGFNKIDSYVAVIRDCQLVENKDWKGSVLAAVQDTLHLGFLFVFMHSQFS